MQAVTIYLSTAPCFPALGFRDEDGALRIGQRGLDCSRPLKTHEVSKVIAVQNAGMTTTEKLARYETAQHIIGMMVAMRSRWISDEEKKAQPNQVQIAQWEQEQSKFVDQDNALMFDDSDGIEWVIASYGPVVKAQFEVI